MTDTLTDDLRRALRERADEIPEGPAPGLVLGYTAPTPGRSRRVPLAVAGTIAAGLLAVALVAGHESGTTVADPTVATTAQAPASNTTELPTAPKQETDGTFAGFTATNDDPVVWSIIAEGTIDGTRWQLIGAQQDGHRRIGLFADGIQGVFSIDPGPLPADAPEVLHLGPCCRLGTHTIVVAVVSPDVSVVGMTGVDTGSTTWGTFTITPVANPVDPDGWRYVVLDAPAQSGKARVEVQRTDGAPVTEPQRLDLDNYGG